MLKFILNDKRSLINLFDLFVTGLRALQLLYLKVFQSPSSNKEDTEEVLYQLYRDSLYFLSVMAFVNLCFSISGIKDESLSISKGNHKTRCDVILETEVINANFSLNSEQESQKKDSI